MEVVNIGKKEFEKYEKVRESGVTNMWDVVMVKSLSGLSKEQIMSIIGHYEEYTKMFPGVRK